MTSATTSLPRLLFAACVRTEQDRPPGSFQRFLFCGRRFCGGEGGGGFFFGEWRGGRILFGGGPGRGLGSGGALLGEQACLGQRRRSERHLFCGRLRSLGGASCRSWRLPSSLKRNDSSLSADDTFPGAGCFFLAPFSSAFRATLDKIAQAHGLSPAFAVFDDLLDKFTIYQRDLVGESDEEAQVAKIHDSAGDPL